MRVALRTAALAGLMMTGSAIAGDHDSRFPQAPGQPGNGSFPDRANYTEGFANIAANGWTYQNLSVPIGTTNYFQGNGSVFPAHTGAANDYLGTNFNNVAGNNTISNWAYSPVLNIVGNETVTFYTRTVDAPFFPDRLRLRYDPTGSTNAANYGTILVTVNPNLTAVGYPTTWTAFSVNMTPAQASATGRFAFHYDVPGGGPSGANSDYIGIDTFSVVEVPEPGALGVIALGAIGMIRRRRA